ncbi:S-layer homology domain-containing protein [Paenibacillus hamazuiensis]|uniref:S-layer homology domain-containing protein n=1 Tax=Paenibacillus hamazuiensis TaxID=2936508 RepID=UPI00200EA2D9
MNVKQIKRWLTAAGMAVVAGVFFVFPALAENPAFSDIADHWAKKDILNAVQEKYVDGYPNGTFEPDTSITRAEFIKMIVAALKFQPRLGADGPWYQPYVDAAVANGIHQYEEFYGDNIMNGAISREEVSRLAVRATGQANYESKKWMYLATSKGIIQGLDDTGTLGEDQVTTRAQAITVIERIKKVRAGETLPVQKQAVNRAELKWHKTNIFMVMPQFFGADGKSKIYPEFPWDESKLIVETPDGLFKGALDQLVAIDMEDPNDPNRWILGDIDGLLWSGAPSKPGYPIKDYPQSYVLFFDRHTNFNNDTSKYGRNILYGFYGITSPDRNALYAGSLNKIAPVYVKSPGDYPAFIIPKKGFALDNNEIAISIYAPAYDSREDQSRFIIKSYVPDTLGK